MAEEKPVPVVETPVQTEVIETPTYTEDEQRAIDKGWKPKDQWEGDEGEWKPAKVFNEIGELKDKLSDKEKDLKKSNKVLALMKQHHVSVRQAAYQQAIQDLKAQRVQALANENFAQAEQIRDQIEDVNIRFRTDNVLPPAVEAEARAAVQEPDPEYFAFSERNPWYKPGGKDEMSKEADALGAAYKIQYPESTFKELIKDVEKKIRKLYPEKFERPSNPVNESGSRGGGSGGSSGGNYKLTDMEKAVAKEFGMTEAAYAKELNSYKGR